MAGLAEADGKRVVELHGGSRGREVRLHAVSQQTDARRALLDGLFDDAGLFPPASLSMADAVAGHIASRATTNAWMLDGFVCPASRLTELRPGEGEPWRVSVILDAANAALRIRVFELRAGGRAVVAQAEGRPAATTKEAIGEVVDRAGGRTTFIEIPAGDEAAVDAVAAFDRAGVKVRCDGDIVPPASALAVTIAACRDRGLRLKATAGLHHPYPGDAQHGFLNLAAAAVAATTAGASVAGIERILRAGPDTLRLSAEALDAAGVSADAAACAQRASLLAGIGSCSFAEPVDDLTALGILPL